MINFFRKIRKKMADDNKPMKYMRYAIGEIILVVIGILIALSINNWNEKRIEKGIEKEVYENLLGTLQRDSLELINILAIQNKSLEKQRLVIQSDFFILQNSMSESEINQLLLDICSGIFSFFPKYGTYNSILSNNGLDILKSKKIKALLIELYDFECLRYENMDKIIDQRFQFEVIPFMNRELDFFWNGRTVSKEVNINLLENKYHELALVCSDGYGVMSNGKDSLINIQKLINELIMLIKKELSTKG